MEVFTEERVFPLLDYKPSCCGSVSHVLKSREGKATSRDVEAFVG
jgi:hypothetical protein